MLCNKCQCELRVEEGKITSEIDSTDVYMEHIYKCKNPNCDNFKNDQIVEVKKIKIN